MESLSSQVDVSAGQEWQNAGPGSSGGTGSLLVARFFHQFEPKLEIMLVYACCRWFSGTRYLFTHGV
jgi:hypothetical protein